MGGRGGGQFLFNEFSIASGKGAIEGWQGDADLEQEPYDFERNDPSSPVIPGSYGPVISHRLVISINIFGFFAGGGDDDAIEFFIHRYYPVIRRPVRLIRKLFFAADPRSPLSASGEL